MKKPYEFNNDEDERRDQLAKITKSITKNAMKGEVEQVVYLCEKRKMLLKNRVTASYWLRSDMCDIHRASSGKLRKLARQDYLDTDETLGLGFDVLREHGPYSQDMISIAQAFREEGNNGYYKEAA
jgi:hypothetical protein